MNFCVKYNVFCGNSTILPFLSSPMTHGDGGETVQIRWDINADTVWISVQIIEFLCKLMNFCVILENFCVKYIILI